MLGSASLLRWMAVLGLVAPGLAGAQFVSITGGPGATESFDSLASSGTGSAVPPGWYFAENAAAGAAYTASDGNATAGDTYSFGTGTASERAFGMIASGSVIANIGARLQNNTGSVLTELLVEYTGEQWRLGDINGADKLDFQYCVSSCALTDALAAANWTNFNALDFVSPLTAGTAGSALNGNLAANQTAKSATISGLSVAVGGQIWIRWFDSNDAGVDDALSIDNVHLAVPGDFPPVVVSTTPATGATGVLSTTNIALNFNEPVTVSGAWFDINCGTSGAHTAIVSGGPSNYTLNPDVDFAFGETCTVLVRAAQVVDQDGTPDLMSADYTFSFQTAADLVPSVTTTVPANGASNVLAAANVVINFSEPVAVSSTWFDIACTLSGAHAASVSGGPSSFTLDPASDFTFGETCTTTVHAALVVDQDGTPNPLAADYVFSFNTAADTAPTVATTTPTNASAGAGVAANITINFSEAVTATGSWFTINCANSGAHAAAAIGGPTSYVLDPAVDFGFLEVCTVTVVAAQVADVDGTPTPMAANYVFSFTTAADGSNYYASVDASSATTLRTTLHNLIKDHTAFTYFGVWTVLEAADQDPLNTGKILDVYRNRSYTKIDCRSGMTSSCPTGANNRYNREHTWPNSHGFNDLSGTDTNGNPYSPYTDAHMLYLSAEDYNSHRGNNPYGNCSGCSEDPTDAYNGFGGGTGTYPGNSNWNGASVYETWNHRKGDTARAVLYMDIRYDGGTAANGQPEPDLIVTDNTALITTTPSGQVVATGYMGLKTALVQWHDLDPPDAQEIMRNDVVQSYQHNRNPFIDHPEWVACLYQNVCTASPPVNIFADGFE
jgi:endonuclease I